MTCNLTCKQLIDQDDFYKIKIGSQHSRPPLQYIKVLVTFHHSIPNKAGIKWKTRSSPCYYENTFEGWMQSKLLMKLMFPFIQQIIREDLYQNGQSVAERHSAEIFTSKRNSLF